MTNKDLDNAAKVLQAEIEGLQALKESINDTFTTAVTTIDTMRKTEQSGRLIIAGIGKSGHVARKIAATMASTGTPAYYVHPGEASHGDLGMITKHDVVLMLSNSGENAELSDLTHYTRRFGINLISITSNAGSTLAQHSDTVLLLPKAAEACPNGLAPTTSTTMMMALGDALAVALLNRINLTPDQFKAFHPGGKLGQKLLQISDLMIPRTDMATIENTATMDQAIVTLTEKNLGAVIVMDDQNNMQGIITDGDLKRHMAPDLLQKPVTDIMSTTPKTINQSKLAVQAMDIMTQIPGHYLTSLIVVDDNDNLSGLIRLQDCLQAGVD